jgi:hypothetical protein
MYYPPVYYFHEVLMSFAGVLAAAQLIETATVWALLFSVGTGALCIWSIRYFVHWRPKRLRAAIERNRVIWLAALREQIANNAEATTTGRR